MHVGCEQRTFSITSVALQLSYCHCGMHIYGMYYRLQISNNTKCQRSTMSSNLRQAINRDLTSVNILRQYVLKISAVSEHRLHYIGPVSWYSKHRVKAILCSVCSLLCAIFCIFCCSLGVRLAPSPLTSYYLKLLYINVTVISHNRYCESKIQSLRSDGKPPVGYSLAPWLSNVTVPNESLYNIVCLTSIDPSILFVYSLPVDRSYVLVVILYLIYSVSQKNIPDIFSRNTRKHCRIFIIFGICVTDKVSNQ